MTRGSRRRVARWFYIGVGLFMVALSVAGFGPSIVDTTTRNRPVTPLVAAHGLLVSAWLLLFVTQATLVATRRTDLHRRLGAVGLVLAIAMVAVGWTVTLQHWRRGFDLSGDLTRAFVPAGARRPGPAVLLFPLAELLNFGALVAAGLWYRRRPEVHKRLMLFALLVLAAEPAVHLVGHLVRDSPARYGSGRVVGPVVTMLLLSLSAIHDRLTRGRLHPVSLWVPIALVAWLNLVPLIVLLSGALRTAAAGAGR